MAQPSRRSKPLPRDWRTIRRRVLERDDWVCRWKGPTCIGHATQVDHTTPAYRGGSDDATNLAAICEPCHLSKTGAEARAAQPNRARPPEQHPGFL